MNPKRKVSKRPARVRCVDEEVYGGDDDIRPSHASVRWGLPNIGQRYFDECDERRNSRCGPGQGVRRRRDRTNRNDESHCPKYGRQDLRHQLPRRRAKEERLDALWEREFRAMFGHPSNEHHPDDLFAEDLLAVERLEYDRYERHLVSVEEQEEWRRQDVMDEWAHELELAAEWDVIVARMEERRVGADESTFLSSDLRDDPYCYYDDHYDHYAAHHNEQPPCIADDFEVSDMRRDIFEGYGECDHDLDTLSHGQASQLRFSDRRPTRRMLNDLASL